MIGARKGSPLAVGYGNGEMYLGSDAIALAPFTDAVSYLEDGDWAVLTRKGVASFDDDGNERRARRSSNRRASAHAGGQGQSQALHGQGNPRAAGSRRPHARALHRHGDGARRAAGELAVRLEASSSALSISACGTAFYAGLVAKYWFERFAKLPVEIDIASEFRYREAPLETGDLAIFISQSGETADTLATLRYAKEQQAARARRSSTCRPRPSRAKATW